MLKASALRGLRVATAAGAEPLAAGGCGAVSSGSTPSSSSSSRLRRGDRRALLHSKTSSSAATVSATAKTLFLPLAPNYRLLSSSSSCSRNSPCCGGHSHAHAHTSAAATAPAEENNNNNNNHGHSHGGQPCNHDHHPGVPQPQPQHKFIYQHLPVESSTPAGPLPDLCIDPPQGFSVVKAVENASLVLPHQGILENFVHHNPLQTLESLTFHRAMEYVHELETYITPGERMLGNDGIDPRHRTGIALANLCSVFLDRGAAKWAPTFRNRGFLYFFADLESLGLAFWRKYARSVGAGLLASYENESASPDFDVSKWSTYHCEKIIIENLQFFGVPPAQWERTILCMLLEVPGWAGMFHRMETRPDERPRDTTVRLLEFAAVQSILARSSIAAQARESGWDEKDESFAEWLIENKPIRHKRVQHATVQDVSAVAFVDQGMDHQDELEQEFEDALLHAMNEKPAVDPASLGRPTLQFYACMDDREGSLRRYIEEINYDNVETFGIAGFFGIPVLFKAVQGGEGVLQAPEGSKPSGLMEEREDKTHPLEVQNYQKRRRLVARFSQFWEAMSFSPSGGLVLSTLMTPISLARLFLMGFFPEVKQKIRESFNETVMPTPHTDFDLPLPVEMGADFLDSVFKLIGTQNRFARLVVILGHGASSINNPFFAAYNCGACCGHEGAPNARVFARFANDPNVRQVLKTKHNIDIPEDTWFVGGYHNTTSDMFNFFDDERVPQSHLVELQSVRKMLIRACGKNALERCHRFLLAHVKTPDEALHHVYKRSIDPAEVRPELNHATNAAVVVGRRSLTKGRFLDRRVFLPSYDPYSDDDRGSRLEGVLMMALGVCSGINLEYFFSSISADRHGTGSKAPLNIVGNIGVQQGTVGDLRPGLPSQMTEMHTPVRALFVIDAPVARVKTVVDRTERMCQLIYNEWVRLIVRDPDTGRFFRVQDRDFVPVTKIEDVPLHSFEAHRQYGLTVAQRESAVYYLATAGLFASCIGPIYLFGASALNPLATATAISASALTWPVLAFSRRYLHGEFMFVRFSMLSVGLLLGFNLVATAPSLHMVMAGWGLFGFASTFLIGSYNDRPSVRNNATFAFAAYRLSDFALLTAATFTGAHALETGQASAGVAAGALMIAALYKSSQFPLTALFARSMEGPTPTSALGYAGLSAHVGVILLASTMSFWFPFDLARLALAGVGLYTAFYGGIVSRIRADRKGAIAYATSSTLGFIFVTLALGYQELAMLMCLGHAAFRMNQILLATNHISAAQFRRTALGHAPWPKPVPDWLYRAGWALHRIDTDFHLIHFMHRVMSPLKKTLVIPPLSKVQQWILTSAGVVVAGIPFTPFSESLEHAVMQLLLTQPMWAVFLMVSHFGISVVTIRVIFSRILQRNRFHREFKKKKNLLPHEQNVSPNTPVTGDASVVVKVKQQG